MTDYTDLKVPVFTGVNDLPTAPTATKASNGSHIIETLNNLIDRLSTQPTSVGNYNWNIISSDITDVTLEANSKNLIIIGTENNTSIVIRTPANISPGDYVTLLKVHEELICDLAVYPQIRNHGNESISLATTSEEITLVYLNQYQGWILSRNNVLTFVQNPL